MAKNAEVGSKTSLENRSAKNLSTLGTWLRILKMVVIVMMMIMKRFKDHLFLRSQIYLLSILSSYTLEKNKFPIILLTKIEALS